MMTLINGKFYVNGKEVPVEIGNKEQIELIKKAEYMREHGVDIAVDVEEKKMLHNSSKLYMPVM
jgi:hypothetical protein